VRRARVARAAAAVGIGGPAVGNYLRLHPALAVIGPLRRGPEGVWGAPQTALSHEFDDTGDGYGLLIEGAQYAPSLIGSASRGRRASAQELWGH